MPEIEEDAFRIAKIMFDHRFVGANAVVVADLKKMVDLEPSDFDMADSFLLELRYCEGTMGGDTGRRILKAAGIAFAKARLSEEDSKKKGNVRTNIQYANQLYAQVETLAHNLKPADQEKAALIIELADDALKEYGNTNQDKKVRLKTIRKEVEELLPPATIEDLRKRAEGQLLKRSYPRNTVARKVVLGTIAFILIASVCLTLFNVINSSRSTKLNENNGSPSPVPIDPEKINVERNTLLIDLGYDIYAYGLGRDANLDNQSLQNLKQEIERKFKSLGIKPSSTEIGPALYFETGNGLASQFEKKCFQLGKDIAALYSLGAVILFHPNTNYSNEAQNKIQEAAKDIENSLLELNLIPTTYLTKQDLLLLEPNGNISSNEYFKRLEEFKSKTKAALRARYNSQG